MISFVFEGRRTKIPTYDLVFQKSAGNALLEYATAPPPAWLLFSSPHGNGLEIAGP